MDLSSLQRDIAEIGASLAQGLEALIFGSFADRNPGLGRMVRCPFCRTRRRQFATEPCCNTGHATTKRAWDPAHDIKGKRLDERTDKGFGPSTRHEKGFYQDECPPRVVEEAIPKSLIRRIKHKRHRNIKRNEIHCMALELQDETYRNTTQLLLEGLPGFHEPERLIPSQNAPAFAEKVVNAVHKNQANRKRKQQQDARRINFGLKRGLDG